MKPRGAISFRSIATDHLAKAKTLLEGGPDHEIYACLELRMALAAIAYEILQSYSDDLSEEVNAAFREWHPRAVLDHLLAHDPLADRPLRIVMRAQPVYQDGSRGEAIVIDETEDRFDAKWASKAHAALSSFLHQPTIARRRSGKAIDRAKLRKKAKEVIVRLDSIVASKLSNARLDLRFGYLCPACGRDLSVAILPLMMGAAQTSCSACDTVWDVSPGDGDVPQFTEQREKS
jgi:hypothetical protein